MSGANKSPVLKPELETLNASCPQGEGTANVVCIECGLGSSWGLKSPGLGTRRPAERSSAVWTVVSPTMKRGQGGDWVVPTVPSCSPEEVHWGKASWR